ncbi:IS21 family transposase [Planctomicrobium sp. SH527]|uniref:IS21 family transposase n=1 Tax=Planctomicrobium sp. SH527 TaxID=3448123 RepID=UPI003F5C6BA3
MLAHAKPPGYRRTRSRSSKLDPFLPVIQQILKADKSAHRKQRHTAKRIFERMQNEHGYSGGQTLVAMAVRDLKQKSREVFLPLSHPPGESQVDFGFADVHLNGVLTKVALFVMTLPYSDAIFLQAFPRECTESFQEGHMRAFEFFGGVPTRISYDNSKVAMSKVISNRERVLTKECLRLKSHFLYEEHFCLVRRPNEKGHVERLLDYARKTFLVPVPQVRSLEELNAQLAMLCEKDLQRTLRGKPSSKQVLLDEERDQFFRPIPKEEFSSYRVEPTQADALSLVRFDRNSYSVPTKYAYRPIIVKASIDQVHLICDGIEVACHSRCWDKEQTFYNPIHYLALLERKPGGFDHARPLENWDLPVSFDILRRRFEAEFSGRGTREFIKVLRLLEKHSLSSLKDAVQHELGYVPASKVGAELLFDVISTAYERLSLIVTTNLPFENWTEVLGSERLTGAALDRLTHRCHILEFSGESYRLADANRRRQNPRAKPSSPPAAATT